MDFSYLSYLQWERRLLHFSCKAKVLHFLWLQSSKQANPRLMDISGQLYLDVYSKGGLRSLPYLLLSRPVDCYTIIIIVFRGGSAYHIATSMTCFEEFKYWYIFFPFCGLKYLMKIVVENAKLIKDTFSLAHQSTVTHSDVLFWFVYNSFTTLIN